MADHSKEYDSDDERSVSVSHRSKAEYRVNDSDSPSLEQGDAYCGDYASKDSEKRTSKGGKAVAALRNAQHDRLIDEYKTQFSKPENTDDEISVQSSQKSAQSDDEGDVKGARTVARYGHSSKQRDSEYHHQDTLQILRYSKQINDASESDEDSSEHDEKSSKREEHSKDQLQSKNQSESTHEVKTHSHKTVEKQILPPREKIYLMEQEPPTNQVDVERAIEPKMKPVSFDGTPIGLRHPPPIHIDFGKGSPVEEDELSELYSSDNEEEQQEHVITSTEVTKEKHEAGAQATHTQEFESKKSIHDIANMFGGSVAQKRAQERMEHDDEINLSEEPSKVKHNVPPIAQKYVDALNAPTVIKNRTSAFDELAFHDEEQQPEASEHEQQEERVQDELHSESEGIEKLPMSEEERFMSVRVVRNVREYVREHGGTDDMIIKIPAYAEQSSEEDESSLSTKSDKVETKQHENDKSCFTSAQHFVHVINITDQNH
ncbi:hypothetical protein Tcan_11550 [Toxocara canis]|uniref:Uncharacterized protein n=1 Tax=Toxocara canis TaxID=6265 RepID=A0A0B2UVG4_TOXCA|nr:hypothetical protein Tcan_11550 [Toxocara canis]